MIDIYDKFALEWLFVHAWPVIMFFWFGLGGLFAILPPFEFVRSKPDLTMYQIHIELLKKWNS